MLKFQQIITIDNIICNELPQIHKIKNGRPIIGSIIIDYELYKIIDDSVDEKYRKEYFSYFFSTNLLIY